MAVVVLFLDDAVVGEVRACGGCADGMDELVLGAAVIGQSVGEKRGGAAHAKDAVADELGWFISHVATLSDNLCGYH